MSNSIILLPYVCLHILILVYVMNCHRLGKNYIYAQNKLPYVLFSSAFAMHFILLVSQVYLEAGLGFVQSFLL